MNNTKIKMKVVPQVSGLKNARRGQPALKKDTILWCIEYEKGGIFTYAYYRKMDAIKAMQTMKQYGTDTEQYYYFNVVRDVTQALHVMPKDKK